MKGMVISGGDKPSYNRVKTMIESMDYICAADSGLDYCRDNNIEPHKIIGDMDSLSHTEILDEYPAQIIERYPKAKDYTDTELGLMDLKKNSCSESILLGGGGGRLDHLLGIVSLFSREAPPSCWITAHERIESIAKVYEGQGSPGEMISFFPLGREECRMRSQGLKWPLDNFTWKTGDCGLSNRLIDTNFTIIMTSGKLLMIRALEGDPLYQ